MRIGQGCLVAKLEQAEVVVIGAERKERHHALIAHHLGHAENVAIESRRAFQVAYLEYDVAERLDLHGCLR